MLKNRHLIKSLLFLVCLTPLAWNGFALYQDMLGANPVEQLVRNLGWWGFNLLLITLTITPLRRLTGINSLIHYRRMLGLFCFFYITVHLLVFFGLEHDFIPALIIADITERPYITIGFAAWLMLIALSVTSNRWAIRRLGSNWKRLHQLVYLIAILGVIHFFWLTRADFREPVIYALLFGTLLGYRVYNMIKSRPTNSI